MNKNILLLALAAIVAVSLSLLLAGAGPKSVNPHISTVNTRTQSPGRDLPLQAEYHVNLPNGIILVDSQGRRTGKDPATGTIYREIPGTSYAEDCLSKTNCAGELFTNNVVDGRYTFYVIGGISGKYGLSVYNNRGLSQVFRGDIKIGAMAAYVQDYLAAAFASSTLSFQSTVSSTAGITSELPHNLPLQ